MKNERSSEVPPAADLETFRRYAEAMRDDEPADWQWIGRWESQRHFGITERRARTLRGKYGGHAKPMSEDCEAPGDALLEDRGRDR